MVSIDKTLNLLSLKVIVSRHSFGAVSDERNFAWLNDGPAFEFRELIV